MLKTIKNISYLYGKDLTYYIGDICVYVSRFNTRKNIVWSAVLFVCEHPVSGSQAAVGPKDTENSSFQNAISAVSF